MKKTKENEINERGRKIKELEKKIAKMQRTGRDLQDRNQKRTDFVNRLKGYRQTKMNKAWH